MKFLRDESGLAALLIALLIPIILGILAITIDLGKVQTEASNNNKATDAAALGTAEWILKGRFGQINTNSNWRTWLPPTSSMNSYALSLYNSNLSADSQLVNPSTDLTVQLVNSVVTVTACPSVKPNAFASSIGLSKVAKVCSSSKAQIMGGQVSNTMVAFSLDYTASMTDDSNDNALPIGSTQSKIYNLGQAMQSILTTYFNGQNIYGSVSPFTVFTNISPYDSQLVDPTLVSASIPKGDWFANTGGWWGSTNASTPYSLAIAVTVPSTGTVTGLDPNTFQMFAPYQNIIGSNPWNHSMGGPIDNIQRVSAANANGQLSVQPMTNNNALLLNMVQQGVTAAENGTLGGTAGLPGIFNAWLTMSPAYANAFSGASAFESKNGYTTTRPPTAALSSYHKVIIHISDGEDNAGGIQDDSFVDNNATYTGGRTTPLSLNDNAITNPDWETICSQIKNNGVEIYIILYGLSTSAQQYHKDCVTDSSHLFTNVPTDQIASKLNIIFSQQAAHSYTVQLQQ